MTTENSVALSGTDAYVISINSDKMGAGEEELGKLLIKGFVNTIHKLTPLPGRIVLYSSGAKLVAVGSGVDDALKALEAKGVEILVCGTCVDYYSLKDNMAAGNVSNMYEISQTLASAGHVVTP